MGKVYASDVGTLIKLDTGVDVTSATVKIVAKPSGSGDAVDLEATVVESTKVQHQKTADTLNAAGNWRLQAYVEMGGGKYFGEIVELPVYEPL